MTDSDGLPLFKNVSASIVFWTNRIKVTVYTWYITMSLMIQPSHSITFRFLASNSDSNQRCFCFYVTQELSFRIVVSRCVPVRRLQ